MKSTKDCAMSATTTRTPSTPRTPAISTKGAERAFLLLRTVFTVAPIAFGVDKFASLLTDWPGYLAPWIDAIVPGTAQQAMYAVGIVEVVAGIVVALAPRYGSLLVSAWLVGIIVNLLTLSGFYDVALRDVGLLVGALALAALVWSAPSGHAERA